jgi:proteasome accessory factor B
MAEYQVRIDRLKQLESLIPVHLKKEDCPDSGRLLTSMAGEYELKASRRAIQRDLEALVKERRIEAVNPGGKPLRYRRLVDAEAVDPRMWDYARRLMGSLIRDALPERRFERIWTKLREDCDEYGLGEDKLCILSDSQRLLPADIREEALAAALEALSRSRSLQAAYRDRDGKLSYPTLHPQALLQRGPRIYLFALKNEESEPVRMYALHRFIRAQLGDGAARIAESFNLKEAIRKGQGDFAGDRQIELDLRVRGYVAELLRDCPLSEDQRIEEEPDGSAFGARVRATVPDTGQLLRWVLGCGDNVEVLGPTKLRDVLTSQTTKAAALYGGPASSLSPASE